LDAFATFKKVSQPITSADIQKTEEGKYYKHLRRFPGQNFGDLTAIQITPDCHNIMTCAKDTTILMWDLKGNIVDKLQSKQLAYNMAIISPNGQYLAIATAMSDIKVIRAPLFKSDEPQLHKVNYLSPDSKGQKGQNSQPAADTGNSIFTGIEKTHFTRLDGHGVSSNSIFFLDLTKFREV
jgi:WD40 repeat protein